ncbi:RING finger protein 207-like [Protopterus annectens]|uniref:RING finger protein 207-like n=1 Tax=Protopterus annectens TaxID=7888 RepID=UPI001CFBF3D0|nr:RING finger protein 207-like [Protopterus annectens]
MTLVTVVQRPEHDLPDPDPLLLSVQPSEWSISMCTMEFPRTAVLGNVLARLMGLALQLEIQCLKDQVQEMHRDLTKHHSLIKTDGMGDILQKSLEVDIQIASEYSSVEMMRSMFEEIWEDTYQRVSNEQEIYEAQLHDLMQLKQENNYLTTITKQIAPYIRSIAKVKERLEPRLKEPKEVKDDRTESMIKIYDESGVTVEMQHRNDLTSSSDDNREKISDTKLDNRTLNILSDDPLIKTKEYYNRTKQKNVIDNPSRKELAV